MKLYHSLLALLFMLLPSLANSAVAITAQKMAAYLPDRVLTFSSTKPPTLLNESKKHGTFHRVQNLSDADNWAKLAAVAVISGAGVSSNIAIQFSNDKLADAQEFKAVLQASANPPASVSMSPKLAEDEMITFVVLNLTDVNDAKKSLNVLDLKRLAGASVK